MDRRFKLVFELIDITNCPPGMAHSEPTVPKQQIIIEMSDADLRQGDRRDMLATETLKAAWVSMFAFLKQRIYLNEQD